MAYYVGLIFDYLRIKIGQGFDEALVILLIFRLGILVFIDFPIKLDMADRTETFQHGLILRSPTCKELRR